jgi:hypothetical protein
MTILQHLTASPDPLLATLIATAPEERCLTNGFDNRTTWDNKTGGGGFDNRPTWDNWNNR